MYDLLRASAGRAPDALAAVYAERRLTYAELLAAADSVAAGLVDRGLTRFAVLDPDPTVVLPLLAGASRAGVEACVYPPTATPEAVEELAERFDHDVLVTTRPDLTAPYAVLTPESLTGATAGPVSEPAATPHLVLTTGTTGAPRAVRHDWSRLTKPSAGAPAATGQRWLLAYGMNQFGGLQVLLHVLASGATLVATEVFAPAAGLAAMRAHAVTHASATPTFWRFLLAELAADGGSVPALEQITLGGEAPSEQVLASLRSVFPDARITQIYAANEFGAAGSVRDAVNGLPTSALQTGADVDLKVVDGQLFVRSRVGMLGYYGEDPVDPDDWRPTGDLVEVVGDRVLFRGRTSEVINVGGVKVHPLPVEERVSAVPGVTMARVFGRPNKLTGAVVAVEVVLAPGADPDTVDAALREACQDLPPASRPRSIRFVDEIVTTGHKIVRR